MQLTCGDDSLGLRAQLLPALRPLVEIDDENCVNAIPEWRFFRFDGRSDQNTMKSVVPTIRAKNKKTRRLDGSLQFARECGKWLFIEFLYSDD